MLDQDKINGVDRKKVEEFVDKLAVLLSKFSAQEGMSMLIMILVDTVKHSFGIPKEVFINYVNNQWDLSEPQIGGIDIKSKVNIGNDDKN